MKDTAHITNFTPLEQLVISTNGISLFVNVNFVAEFSKATQAEERYYASLDQPAMAA